MTENGRASFKVLYRDLPGRTEESHEKPEDGQSPKWYLNPGPSQYKAGVLITVRPARAAGASVWTWQGHGRSRLRGEALDYVCC
jgi:hypothetical protein